MTSIGKNHSHLHEQLLDYIKKNGARLGFNPGTHQINEGVNKISPLMKMTTAFIVNKEEGNKLLRASHRDIKLILSGLKEYGPEIVVVTDGPKGTYAFDGHEYYYTPIFPAPRVEATGAGDSFSTGFIAALIYGKEIGEALKWGNINAASVIQKIGPQAGLMKKATLIKTIKKHQSFQSKKI